MAAESNAAPPRYQLDAFDMQILKVLSEDARLSNRKIALALGVTEGTIRGRLKRLQEEELSALHRCDGPILSGQSLDGVHRRHRRAGARARSGGARR